MHALSTPHWFPRSRQFPSDKQLKLSSEHRHLSSWIQSIEAFREKFHSKLSRQGNKEVDVGTKAYSMVMSPNEEGELPCSRRLSLREWRTLSSVLGLAMGLYDGSLANRPGCITTSGRNSTLLEIANKICRHPKVGKEVVKLLTCENSHGTVSHRALPRLYDLLCSTFRAPARIQKDAHSSSRIFLAISTKKDNLTNQLNKRHLRTSRIYHLHSAKQFISEHISLSFTPSSDPGGFSSARKGATITHQQVETQRHNTCGLICTLRK